MNLCTLVDDQMLTADYNTFTGKVKVSFKGQPVPRVSKRTFNITDDSAETHIVSVTGGIFNGIKLWVDGVIKSSTKVHPAAYILALIPVPILVFLFGITALIILPFSCAVMYLMLTELNIGLKILFYIVIMGAGVALCVYIWSIINADLLEKLRQQINAVISIASACLCGGAATLVV